MKKLLLSASLLPLFLASHAMASTINLGLNSPFIASVRVGTLGIGPELMYHPVNASWGVRADFDTFNFGINNVYNNSQNIDGYETIHNKYGANLKLMNGSIYGDYYPWKGKSAFRLTAGLIFSTNGFSIDGATRDDAGNVLGAINGHGKYHPVAPYVGIGFNTRISKSNFYVNGDLGAMFQGGAHVSV